MPVRELLGYHNTSGNLIEDAAECYERLTGSWLSNAEPDK
jgi:hypothetical protein